jgi:hypothetical protein
MTDPWESLALGPDQTYAFAPDMAAELFDLLATVAEQATEQTNDIARRTTLLRQLALMDRLCEAGGGALGQHKLTLAAGRLADYDHKHATGHGPIPAADRAWELDPVGYVRQEYAWLLAYTADKEAHHDATEPGGGPCGQCGEFLGYGEFECTCGAFYETGYSGEGTEWYPID